MHVDDAVAKFLPILMVTVLKVVVPLRRYDGRSSKLFTVRSATGTGLSGERCC